MSKTRDLARAAEKGNSDGSSLIRVELDSNASNATHRVDMSVCHYIPSGDVANPGGLADLFVVGDQEVTEAEHAHDDDRRLLE